MTLYVHNTRSGEKEEFRPLNGNQVGMYVCGVTVYDDFHVGHARSYVSFDIIRRYLTFSGYDVRYVQNFTDVDDKIINRAQERGIDPLQLSREYIEEYYKDTDRLNILRADSYPKATEYIPEMLTLIKGLVEKGHAYPAEDGSVYFEIETAKDRFGQLRHQSLDDMLDGARVEVDERKRSPKDFALWKAAKPGEISWESPWGKGRPGWHIECSAMSTKLIGNTLDIHGGGMDLIFPHHESEILQTECFTGEPFAKYWVHNGLLNLNEEKMSKSLDNFFSVKQILKDFDPMVLRFFLAYSYYRSPIEFSEAALEEAKKGYDRLKGFRERLVGLLDECDSENTASEEGQVTHIDNLSTTTKEQFIKVMDDDFNTREAMAVVFTMVGNGNRILHDIPNPSSPNFPPGVLPSLRKLLKTFDLLTGEILGLTFEAETMTEQADSLTPHLIELLIEVRAKAREDKNWALADIIRDRFKELGVVLEDKGGKTTWKIEKN
jgi:cysteinyl-tRNA synthetase